MTRTLLLLALAGCAHNAHGDRIGDGPWTVSAESCEWAHRPGDRYEPDIRATLAVWREHVGPVDIPRTEVCMLPAQNEGVQAWPQGTNRQWSLQVRAQPQGHAPERRLVIHELLHMLASRAGMGLRGHDQVVREGGRRVFRERGECGPQDPSRGTSIECLATARAGAW